MAPHSSTGMSIPMPTITRSIPVRPTLSSDPQSPSSSESLSLSSSSSSIPHLSPRSPSASLAKLRAQTDDSSAFRCCCSAASANAAPSAPEARPSAQKLSLSEGLNLPFLGPVRWSDPPRFLREFVRDPLNVMTLFTVTLAGSMVGINCAIISQIPLLLGILTQPQAELWFELSNQVLCAIGTLGSLLVHPLRCYYVLQVFRWSPQDAASLRAMLSKAGPFVRKPKEWQHIAFVIFLLQVNCVFQYAIAYFMWTTDMVSRPMVLLGCLALFALGSVIFAGLYCLWSPLGWPTGAKPQPAGRRVSATGECGEWDEEAGREGEGLLSRRCEVCGGGKESSAGCGAIDGKSGKGSKGKDADDLNEWRRATWQPVGGATRPQWQGGLLDCWSDGWTAVAATLCCFCVHGWNAERAGFGNKIVHTAMFILFLLGPMAMFGPASAILPPGYMQNFVFALGVISTILGLTYAGYWRWYLRRNFHLPASDWCCGHEAATDFASWYLLPCCSLCQEVRTVRRYNLRLEIPEGPGKEGSCGEGGAVMVMGAPGTLCMEATPMTVAMAE
ncbi:unnamed protein product [Closterium sp. NIES-53]